MENSKILLSNLFLVKKLQRKTLHDVADGKIQKKSGEIKLKYSIKGRPLVLKIVL